MVKDANALLARYQNTIGQVTGRALLLEQQNAELQAENATLRQQHAEDRAALADSIRSLEDAQIALARLGSEHDQTSDPAPDEDLEPAT